MTDFDTFYLLQQRFISTDARWFVQGCHDCRIVHGLIYGIYAILKLWFGFRKHIINIHIGETK